MNLEYYLCVGFEHCGFLIKSESVNKKYKVEMRYKKTFIPENRMGVYILADDKTKTGVYNVIDLAVTKVIRVLLIK